MAKPSFKVVDFGITKYGKKVKEKMNFEIPLRREVMHS